MKVLLSGGWTLGGVTPLLALAEHMKEGNDFFWIGTHGGPEGAVVEAAGIRFQPIFCGKIRRYASIQNFLDLFRIAIGIIQSFFLLLHERPDVHVTAGGFVSLPPAMAGWLLGIPLVVHQEDLAPLRANLFMSRLARVVTVSCPEAGEPFKKFHPVVVGNPVRRALRDAAGGVGVGLAPTLTVAAMAGHPQGAPLQPQQARQRLGLDPHRPTLVVLGGGIGAMPVNERLVAALPLLLPHIQVYHVTGRGKGAGAVGAHGYAPTPASPGYHAVEFVTRGMEDLYAAADLVLCRAGFGTLTELAVFRRAALLVPLPLSAQLNNARFAASHSAAEMLQEPAATPDLLSHVILKLMQDPEQRNLLGENLHQLFGDGDPSRLAEVVKGVAENKKK